jgi:hypothetical protein
VRSGESEDADEEEGRATTFSGEVLGLVAISRAGVLTGVSARNRGTATTFTG